MPICLICNNAVAGLKEYNIKRHYITTCASPNDKYIDQFVREKVVELKTVLAGQHSCFINISSQHESVVAAG